MLRIAQKKKGIRIAAVQAYPHQLPSQLNELKGNLNNTLKLMEQAHQMNVDIVCFPEFIPGSGEEELCRKAKELGLHTIVWLPERSDDKLFSTCTLISSEGQIIGRQRKFHLDWPNEKIFEPGTENVVLDTSFGLRVGITVCVDGWGWPEQTTDLALKGADIVFNALYGLSATKLQQNAALIRAHDNFMPTVFVRTAGHRARFGDFVFENAGNGSMIICPPSLIQGPQDLIKFYPVEEVNALRSWVVAEAVKGETILTTDLDLRAYREARRYWLEKRRKLKMV